MPEIEPPSAQQVQAYLAAYQIESVVEEAINDAVLKQVKDPFGHISQLLMNHSLKTAGSTTDRKNSRRVSLGGVPLMSRERRVSLSMETYQQTQQKKEMIKIAPGEDDSAERASKAGPLTGEELERAMPKKEVQASEELTGKLKAFFTKMDFDGDGSVTKEEAIKFWGKNFAKVNAQSMFNEVDEDGDGSVTWDEFFAFWKNVLGSGYSEEDLIEEVDMMMREGRTEGAAPTLLSSHPAPPPTGGHDDGGRRVGRLRRRPHHLRRWAKEKSPRHRDKGSCAHFNSTPRSKTGRRRVVYR